MVGIKNMKIPTCCRECDLVYSDDLTDLCCSCTGTYTKDYLHEVNSDCPLIDIVTCKECKNRADVDNWCQVHEHHVNEDEWCNYGERRKCY